MKIEWGSSFIYSHWAMLTMIDLGSLVGDWDEIFPPNISLFTPCIPNQLACYNFSCILAFEWKKLALFSPLGPKLLILVRASLHVTFSNVELHHSERRAMHLWLPNKFSAFNWFVHQEKINMILWGFCREKNAPIRRNWLIGWSLLVSFLCINFPIRKVISAERTSRSAVKA